MDANKDMENVNNGLRKFIWFTHTGVDTRRIKSYNSENKATVDLTKYIEVFIKNELWLRPAYRPGYPKIFLEEDLRKVKSIKVDFHSENAPYSNAHGYERIISKYHDVEKIETWKLSSSCIQDAFQLAVISVDFISNFNIINELTRDEEKDIDVVFEKMLTDENINADRELETIKSIVVEFLQFLSFSLHLTFPSIDYSFSNKENVYQSGFIIVKNESKAYYKDSKTDLLGHYICYEENNILNSVLDKVSQIWHKEIPSVYFFLSSLKGSHMNIDNFSKMVFTLESFFNKNVSTDFMKLSIAILMGKDYLEVLKLKICLSESFKIRNEYIHGGSIPNLYDEVRNKEHRNIWEVFYDLKNIVIHLFTFFIDNQLYDKRVKQYINDDLVILTHLASIANKR